MQITACLVTAKHLRDATRGVNAMLATVPRWSGHQAPPALEIITSPFDEDPDGHADRCARTEAPSRFPALYVVPDGPFEAQGEVSVRTRKAFDVALAIRYLVSDANQARVSARNAAYTMEALSKSMKLLLADDNYGRDARTQRDQHIQMCNRMTYGPWNESVGAARAIAIFALSYEIVNEQP